MMAFLVVAADGSEYTCLHPEIGISRRPVASTHRTPEPSTNDVFAVLAAAFPKLHSQVIVFDSTGVPLFEAAQAKRDPEDRFVTPFIDAAHYAAQPRLFAVSPCDPTQRATNLLRVLRCVSTNAANQSHNMTAHFTATKAVLLKHREKAVQLQESVSGARTELANVLVPPQMQMPASAYLQWLTPEDWWRTFDKTVAELDAMAAQFQEREAELRERMQETESKLQTYLNRALAVLQQRGGAVVGNGSFSSRPSPESASRFALSQMGAPREPFAEAVACVISLRAQVSGTLNEWNAVKQQAALLAHRCAPKDWEFAVACKATLPAALDELTKLKSQEAVLHTAAREVLAPLDTEFELLRRQQRQWSVKYSNIYGAVKVMLGDHVEDDDASSSHLPTDSLVPIPPSTMDWLQCAEASGNASPTVGEYVQSVASALQSLGVVPAAATNEAELLQMRDRDVAQQQEIAALRDTNESLTTTLAKLPGQYDSEVFALRCQNGDLKDEVLRLKRQLDDFAAAARDNDLTVNFVSLQREYEETRQACTSMRDEIDKLRIRVAALESEKSELNGQLERQAIRSASRFEQFLGEALLVDAGASARDRGEYGTAVDDGRLAIGAGDMWDRATWTAPECGNVPQSLRGARLTFRKKRGCPDNQRRVDVVAAFVADPLSAGPVEVRVVDADVRASVLRGLNGRQVMLNEKLEVQDPAGLLACRDHPLLRDVDLRVVPSVADKCVREAGAGATFRVNEVRNVNVTVEVELVQAD